MLATYRAVFRAPGTAAFCAAGFVMRLPIAMLPIGLVLIISGRTGHYGFAGVLSACYIFGAAPGAPLQGRLVDRFGQRRVLLPATVVTVAAVVVLAVLLETDAPDWSLVPPAVLVGFSYVSVGSLIRARWSKALAGRPELTTAYSLESVLDELIFVCGPLIATVIATHADPVIVLYVCLALIAGGALWLAALRSTQPAPRRPGGPAHPSALRQPGVLLLSAATLAMGAVFASAEVTMVAFCGQHGHRSLSGLVLALFAAGSGVSGLFYGARRWRADMLARYLRQSLIFGVMPVLFLLATSIGVLAVISFVAGLAIAPTLISVFGLVEQLVPAGALTEGLAWVLTGLNVGYGAGSAVVGGVADAHGARVAFSVTVTAGVVTALIAVLLHRRLRQAGTAGPAASQSVPVS